MIDRFTDSTLAYQHYGFGVNKLLIETINRYLLNKFKIDFTFLNIVNDKNMISRLKIRKNLNRYDRFNLNFYKKVQSGFLNIARKNKKKYQIINSNLDINFNKEIILNKIKTLIKS